MKNIQFLIIAIVFISFSSAMISCGGKSKTATEQQGKEYTSAYICPMHCEGSGSAEAGTCPVCGMDYVINDDHKEDGHDHDEHNHDEHDHEGHSH